MKKVYIFILLLCCASSGFSNGFPGKNITLYSGVNVGYGRMNTNIQNRFLYKDGGGGLNNVDKSDSVVSLSRISDSFLAELILGMRYMYNDIWVVGMEIGGTLDKNKTSKDFYFEDPALNNFKVTTKRKYLIVPALIVGKKLTPQWLLIFKLGLGISKFDVKLSNTTDGMDFSSRHTTLGIVPSVVAEYEIKKNISCAGTVSYERYKSFSKTFSNVIDTAGFNSPNSESIKIKPQVFSFKIGLVFKT